MENKELVTESKIEGRNAVLEAFRSGKSIDKLYVLDGCPGRTGSYDRAGSQKKRHDFEFCHQREAGSDL